MTSSPISKDCPRCGNNVSLAKGWLGSYEWVVAKVLWVICKECGKRFSIHNRGKKQ